jgi:hypothetical protein
MKQYRPLIFGTLGLAVAFIAAFLRGGRGNGAAGFPLLVAFDVTAGLLVAAIIFDTVWHAFKGQGQACRNCGHLRKMSSFRVCGPCPNCGH